MSSGSAHFVDANGISIHYYCAETPEPDKPTIVLLHGQTDSGACWPLVSRALAHDYNVYMPDARGHGQTTGVEAGISREMLAQDVLAFIRVLKLTRPIVFGHSMGARAALTAAALVGESEELRAVILEDPPLRQPRPVQATPDKPHWIFGVKALTEEEREEFCRRENPDWAEEEILPWSRAKMEFDVRLLHASTTLMWPELLPRISCPVLLLTGDTERHAIVTPEIAEEVIHLCPQTKVVHITGAGHNIHRDRFAPTIAVVRENLKTFCA